MRLREALQAIVEGGMNGTGIVDRIADELHAVAKRTHDKRAAQYLIEVADDLIEAQGHWADATGVAEKALRAVRVYQIDAEV